MNLAAMVVRTKPREVSGQIKLTVPLDMRDEEEAEKYGLEENAEDDFVIGDAGFDDAKDFGGADFLDFADLFQSLVEIDDTDGFAEEADEQDGE